MKYLSPLYAYAKIVEIKQLLKGATIVTHSNGFYKEYYVKVMFPTLKEAQQLGRALAELWDP